MTEFLYTSKHDALSDIFDTQSIHTNWCSNKITSYKLLSIISQDTYSLKELGLSAQGTSILLSKMWPDRPKTNSKLCYYLLSTVGLKYCPHCKCVKEYELYYKNSKELDGFNCYCKSCYYTKTAKYKRCYQAKYRAEFSHRVVSWSDVEKIRQFYNNCPDGFHVDHIVPLNGKVVCGLHVLNNLQYLTAAENLEKSNKFALLIQ